MAAKRTQGCVEPDTSCTNQSDGRGGLLKAGWLRWCRNKLYETFVYPLAMSEHPPWYDARGVATGLAVGLGMPVTTHIATLALLRSLFRFNLVVAVAFSCVSNPFNMIPLYYGYYRLGCLVLGRSPSVSLEAFHGHMRPIMDSTYFWDTFAAFLDLGKEILAAWSVAAILLALIGGVTGYVVAYRLQVWRIRRRAHTMGLEYERLRSQLERHQ
ncbi:MAG: DUF2062 domain-containing protein [Deltaproteobacteria bacterium]|nr:DUF2062 domain-containing protein [Deltaproteobacteria bacterium]